MSVTLSIDLLGSPTLTLDGAPVRGFISSKAAALIYYLAATGRTHTRERLAGLLWPEVTDAQANKNLRDVLSNLRRLLNPYLEITRQTVALNAGANILIDSQRFEEDIASGERASAATNAIAHFRAAVGRYQGDFLEGFSLVDAPLFEEWALVERERLRQLTLNALQRLATHAGHQGDYPAGIADATRLLAIDPTREEAHRQLMLLLALSGQRGAALAQYAACRRMLDDELGIEPDAATEALHRRILDGEVIGEQRAPALHAPIRPRYQLPAARAALIGRATERAQVVALLSEPTCRLVTLTGPGGIGKTSLALHAAGLLVPVSQRGEAFAHGIVFVGLAGVDAPADAQAASPILAARVADALRFTFSGPEAPQIQLANYLHERNLLLVLDNCEHLPVADFVVDLLEHAPTLTLLVTSRGRLNVRGEQIVELDGLAFPLNRELVAQPQWDDYSAIQLFHHTAQAVNPRLVWTRAEAAAAARICQLVAGLPLAIELAASLARLMPIEEIAREITANLEFLQSSRRDLPERHYSLRAVFDHSWKLLSPAEQRALRQLSVFRGGFSRDAAAQVASTTLPLLTALVDNSLVRPVANRQHASGRYELLELVRQYAAEQQDAAQPHASAEQTASDRHGRYYLAFLSQRGLDLRGSRQQAAADEITREIENIRAAWRWALEPAQVKLIGPAAESLFFFCEMRSWFREGVDLFAQAADRLAALCVDPSQPLAQIVCGKLLARQGWCTFQIGQPTQARTLLEQSLAILRPLNIVAEQVLPLNYLAAVAYYSGDYAEAERIVEAALAASQASGDRHGAAVALTIFGQIAALVGRYDDARRYSEASLAIERDLGNRWGMVFPLLSLGRVAQALGTNREAQHFFQEGLAIRQAFGDSRGVALCLQYLGDTAEALADYPEASWFYREALALFQAIGNQAGVVAALTKLGYNALSLQEPAIARASFHQALQVAWPTASLPRLLEVLVGIAATLAATAPERAYALGTLVHAHPAATQESRDQAAAILAQLVLESLPPAEAQPQAAQSLEVVVTSLLRDSQ